MIEENITGILGEAGIPPVGLEISGKGPVLSSIFRVDDLAVESVAAATAAAAAVWAQRGGPEPHIRVDPVHAAVAFQSERFFRVSGRPLDVWAELSGDYRTQDGWVRLHCNFPHHQDAALRALGCEATRAALIEACADRTAVEVETAVLAAGGAAAAMRDRREWAAQPADPLVGLTRTVEGPLMALKPADRPLAGVRVLDLTRVVAGPVATRTLAAYGAHVLRVGAAHVPEVPGLVLDTGFGKRSCWLDLRTGEGRRRLLALVAEADIFIQGYRPGAIAELGFGPQELAAVNPGLITVDVSAYERQGPWAGRRGFDSLVQMATGIAYEGMVAAGADHPISLPAQALDHATGYLAAFAAIAGLFRRATEGGSWHAEVSLAATARRLDALGRTDRIETPAPAVDDLLAAVDSPHGVLTFVRPPGLVVGSPPMWDGPPPVEGADPPSWW